MVGQNGRNKSHNKKGKLIRVVRSDLRLKLDRKSPYNPNDDNKINDDKNNNDNNDEKENKENSPKKKKEKNGGWNWLGEFEHEEGLLECYESDLNNFQFRRYQDWKMNALKFTCRTWQCHMVITSPD